MIITGWLGFDLTHKDTKEDMKIMSKETIEQFEKGDIYL